MNILRIVLQTILFSYLTAANASVRDEYLRRENQKEIYRNKSEMCLRNKKNVIYSTTGLGSGLYKYIAVNEPYLELWKDCNLLMRYEFGEVYIIKDIVRSWNTNRVELELFYTNNPCNTEFYCDKYIIDIYIEKEDGYITKRTFPTGDPTGDAEIWLIISNF